MTEQKDVSKDPDVIEAELDETRGRIGEDLRALGDKLTPENVKQELKQETKHMMTRAKDSAAEKLRSKKDAAFETASDVSSKGMHFARENAGALALIGLGLGMLWASRRSDGFRVRERRYEPRETFGEPRETFGEPRETFGAQGPYVGEPEAESLREGESLRERTGERVHQLRERAGGKWHRGAERAKDLSRTARGKAHDLGQSAKGRAVQARQRARDYSQESPLAFGAMAVAAGVGVGLLLPHTRKEDELLGGTRDRLMGEVRETAQEVGRTVKGTAREVKGTITESVTHH